MTGGGTATQKFLKMVPFLARKLGEKNVIDIAVRVGGLVTSNQNIVRKSHSFS